MFGVSSRSDRGGEISRRFRAVETDLTGTAVHHGDTTGARTRLDKLITCSSAVSGRAADMFKRGIDKIQKLLVGYANRLREKFSPTKMEQQVHALAETAVKAGWPFDTFMKVLEDAAAHADFCPGSSRPIKSRAMKILFTHYQKPQRMELLLDIFNQKTAQAELRKCGATEGYDTFDAVREKFLQACDRHKDLLVLIHGEGGAIEKLNEIFVDEQEKLLGSMRHIAQSLVKSGEDLGAFWRACDRELGTSTCKNSGPTNVQLTFNSIFDKAQAEHGAAKRHATPRIARIRARRIARDVLENQGDFTAFLQTCKNIFKRDFDDASQSPQQLEEQRGLLKLFEHEKRRFHSVLADL